MHVMPRRCKLLLKPYFLFGKKRQKQNCTNHWRTSCSLKKLYTKHCAIIYVMMRVYHFYFSKSRRTNKYSIIHLDTEFKRTVFCRFVQIGVDWDASVSMSRIPTLKTPCNVERAAQPPGVKLSSALNWFQWSHFTFLYYCSKPQEE